MMNLTTGSIRRRLIVQLAAVAAILSVVFFFAVRVVAERAATQTQDNILAASATSIADAVYSERGEVRLELPYSALSMLGTISEDRVFYHVLVNDQTLTGYEDLLAPNQDDFATLDYRGDIVRVARIRRPLSLGSRTVDVQVVVGQTRQGQAVVSSRITTTAAAIGLTFFIFATALSALAARNALSPLDRLAAAVRRRGPNDLRPLRAETPREMQPLVDGLNTFMERLRTALTRSEDLITEAAHRVRTPLATVRTQAEVIHRHMKKDENRKAVRDMIRAVDESSRSAGQLLDHAMVTFRSDNLTPQDIDLSALVADTVSRLSPTAELKDMALNLSLPDAPLITKGDPILLQNAMRNILDNAIKYAPEETEIDVLVTHKDMGVIQVIDQGAGFPTNGRDRLVGRFSRGENTGEVVGSGLGLTIVDDVARAHGGHLKISDSPKGAGACVTLYLPLS